MLLATTVQLSVLLTAQISMMWVTNSMARWIASGATPERWYFRDSCHDTYRTQMISAFPLLRMKTTPRAIEGVAIFTIMFWANDGSNTCYDDSVRDTENSRTPPADCGPDTTTLPSVGNRTHTDDYMIALSSLPGTCDHYIPADKNNPATLTDAYRSILKRLAVGKLLQ